METRGRVNRLVLEALGAPAMSGALLLRLWHSRAGDALRITEVHSDHCTSSCFLGIQLGNFTQTPRSPGRLCPAEPEQMGPFAPYGIIIGSAFTVFVEGDARATMFIRDQERCKARIDQRVRVAHKVQAIRIDL